MKSLFKKIKDFFNDLRGFQKGWWQLHVATKDIVYSFYGFGHYGLAKKYADKRSARNGYKHWVVPAGKGSEQLVVFNALEKKRLQRLGLMSRQLSVKDMLDIAYYWSNNKSGKTKTKNK